MTKTEYLDLRIKIHVAMANQKNLYNSLLWFNSIALLLSFLEYRNSEGFREQEFLLTTFLLLGAYLPLLIYRSIEVEKECARKKLLNLAEDFYKQGMTLEEVVSDVELQSLFFVRFRNYEPIFGLGW